MSNRNTDDADDLKSDHDREPSSATVLQPPQLAALAYGRAGFPVFPLIPNAKTPAISEWQKRASADEDEIRQLFKDRPNANIAIHCGESRLAVIDVDPRNGGLKTLEKLQRKNGYLWDYDPATARTGGGGNHYVFRAPRKGRLPSSLGTGVDLLWGNHYFVVSPSIHPNGKCYEWEEGADPRTLGEIPELPPEWCIPLDSGASDPLPLSPQGLDVMAQDGDLSRLADTPDEEARLRSALEHISADCPYAEWRDVVFGIQASGLSNAETIAREWSESVPERYDERDFDRLVRSFREDRRNGGKLIGVGTVFHRAKGNGWVDPRMPIDLWDSPIDLESALRDGPKPIAWAVEDRIQRGRAILLSGLGGTSKTRLLYHLAIGFAVGRLPWNWQITATGKSVLVLTEDSAEDVARTMWGMFECIGLDADERARVVESLAVFPLAGRDSRLLSFKSLRELVTNSNFASLKKKIRQLGDVVFVGLDPALSLTPGDENDQGHQRALGKMADDLAIHTGAAVCLVAHAAKGSLQKDELESHNSRGGGAITDAVRGEFSLRGMTAKEARSFGIADMEERKRLVQLVATKGNHLPPLAFVSIWLRREEGGVLTAANIAPSSNNERQITQTEMRAYEILVDLSRTCPPKIGEWRKECIARGVIAKGTQGAEEKAMQRIVDHLMEGWFVVRGEGRGVYLPLDPDTGLQLPDGQTPT